jgi:hypothetical protein
MADGQWIGQGLSSGRPSRGDQQVHCPSQTLRSARMALPKHTELMRPVLELHADGDPHRGRELEDALVARLGIDAADRAQQNKGGSAHSQTASLGHR